MIQKFVDRFMDGKKNLAAKYALEAPSGYSCIVKDVIDIISEDYDDPDPERIHCIDDGDYQGTRLFIIGEKSYQPSRYWAVYVSYGSCSGCDTFQAINDSYESWNEKPNEQAVNDYINLALHIVQSIKEI